MTMLKPSDCVEAHRSQVTFPWLMEKTGVELKFNDFQAAAAAAKSLQLCPTLCDPIDGRPPGSPIPEILQVRVVEWVAIAFSRFSG